MPRLYIETIVLPERFGGWSEWDRLPLWKKELVFKFLEIEASVPPKPS